MSRDLDQSRGYWGRILLVDLDTGTVEHEDLPDELYERFLGGIGLAAKLLWDRIPVGADPLGPDNVLGFVPGLLTDTGSLFTGRFMVVGKSPATGGWGDANCGGYFSPFLKRCRVDGLFVRGISDKPVYLLLDEDGGELRDAGELWGLDTSSTESALKETHGKRCQVACIGPAGERKSFMAGICNDDGRIAARGGLGAVMGAKGLKAVVATGRARVGVSDKARMKQLSKDFKVAIGVDSPLNKVLGDRLLGLTGTLTRVLPGMTRQPSDLWRLLLARFGTPALTAMSAEGGDSPVKNWGGSGKDFPLSRSQKIGAEAVCRHEVEKYGCFSCPLRCGGIVSYKQGPRPIDRMHKPEYETLCSFGALLLNDDLGSIMVCNDLCNRAGIDTISTGATVAFAIECFEHGLLTTADTDGLELRWGDSAAMITLVERIIARDGIGDVLADGVKLAAERIGKGSDRFAVHSGGIEVPMHDAKYDPAYLATYTCEPTPGHHTISAFTYLELQVLEKQFRRAPKLPPIAFKRSKGKPEGKGEMLAVDSFYKMLVDASGACFFGTQVGGPIPLVDWMNAATGWTLSADDYLAVGERIHQLRHAFNVREGINPARDCRPHPRLYGDPPLSSGPWRNTTLDADGFIREYYRAMHWDLESGQAESAHLSQVGLPEVADAQKGDA
jgi:aldehyde:ferredoxin oxidoreductase